MTDVVIQIGFMCANDYGGIRRITAYVWLIVTFCAIDGSGKRTL